MLVLDTDVLSIVQRGSGVDYQTLRARLDAADDSVYVTIVSFEEQMRGWMKVAAGAASSDQEVFAYAQLHTLLDDYHDRFVLDYDDASAQTFRRLRRARVRIGTMDLRIAAVALTNGATVISRNLVDFRKVPGLRVEDWTR